MCKIDTPFVENVRGQWGEQPVVSGGTVEGHRGVGGDNVEMTWT